MILGENDAFLTCRIKLCTIMRKPEKKLDWYMNMRVLPNLKKICDKFRA